MAQRQIPGGAFIDDTSLWDRQIPGSSFVNETQFPEQGPVTSGVSLLLPGTSLHQQPERVARLSPEWVSRGLRTVFFPVAGSKPDGPARYTSVTRTGRGLAQATLPQVGFLGANGVSCTLFVIANLSSTAFDAVAIGRVRYNNANNFGACLRLNNGRIEYSKGNGTSVWGFVTSVTNQVLTGRNSYAITDQPGGILPLLYRNGIAVSREGWQNENITPSAWDNAMDVGQSTTTGATAITGAVSGSIEVGMWFDRALSAREIQALTADPWQVIAPSPRIWVPGSQVSRVPVTQQPNIPTAKINKNNPITAGLRFLWLPGATPTEQTISSETQNVDTYTSTGKATYWNRVAGGGTLYNERFISDINTSSVSVLYVGAPTASSNRLGIMSQRTTSGTIFGYNLCVNTDNGLSPSPGRLRLAFSRSSSSDVVAVSSQHSKVDGKPHTWVASKTVNVANGEIWCDGNQLPIDSNSINPILPVVAVDQACYVGTLAGDNGFINNTPTYLVAIWDRKLSSTEARDLSINPWQIFADEEKPVEPVTITRTTQPQQPVGVDWSNPLTRGLISAYDFSHAGAKDAALGFSGPTWSGGNGSGVVGPLRGLSMGATPANSGKTTSGAVSSGMTALWVASKTANIAGSSDFLFGEFATGNGAYSWGFYEQVSNGNLTFFIHNGVSGVNATPVSSWNTTSGTQAWLATYGDGDANVRLHLNGAEVSSAAQTGTILAAPGTQLRSGGWNGATRGYTQIAAFVWDRRLSASEIAEVSRNPWQIFAKEPKDTVSPKEDRKNTVQTSRSVLWGASEAARAVSFIDPMKKLGSGLVVRKSPSRLQIRALACPDAVPTLINFVTGAPCLILGSGTSNFTQNPSGFRYFTLTVDRNVIFPSAIAANTTYPTLSFIAVFRLGTTSASKQIWRSRDTAGGWNGVGLSTDSSGFLLLMEENSTQQVFQAISDSALLPDIWYTVVAVATSSGQSLWINGIKQSSTGSAPTGTRRPIGGMRSGGTGVISGDIQLRFGVLFQGTISDAEAFTINSPSSALDFVFQRNVIPQPIAIPL